MAKLFPCSTKISKRIHRRPNSGYRVSQAELFVKSPSIRTQRDLDLLHASAAGDLERMRVLFGRGAKVNTRLKNGATPLLAAAISGHVDAVQLLLIQGA